VELSFNIREQGHSVVVIMPIKIKQAVVLLNIFKKVLNNKLDDIKFPCIVNEYYNNELESVEVTNLFITNKVFHCKTNYGNYNLGLLNERCIKDLKIHCGDYVNYEYFDYLENLSIQDGDISNTLMKKFNLTKEQAEAIVMDWLEANDFEYNEIIYELQKMGDKNDKTDIV
jgi:hypothetical protein